MPYRTVHSTSEGNLTFPPDARSSPEKRQSASVKSGVWRSELPFRSAPWHPAQALSYTFLPNVMAPALRRIDLTMSLTGTEASSVGVARNSPYSSSMVGTVGCAAAVFAAVAIASTTKEADNTGNDKVANLSRGEWCMMSRLLLAIRFLLFQVTREGSLDRPVLPISRGRAAVRCAETSASPKQH